MDILARVRTGLERLLAGVVFALMISLVVIVVLAVVYRKLGASLVWYDEVASIALAWLTYYGAAYAALKRSHIGFAGLVEAAAGRARLTMIWVGEFCVLGFFAVLTWMGYVVVQALEGDTLVSLPWISTQFTQSVIPVGGALFILAQLLSLPDVLGSRRGVDHQ